MACLTKITRLITQKVSFINLGRNLSIQTTKIACSYPGPINVAKNFWIWQINNKIQPKVINKIKIDLPNVLKWVPNNINEPISGYVGNIEMPSQSINNETKEAARLIVIRRKKMKKHKLKKLRKKMKFVWAKKRQRREWLKEKDFQAGLIQQCKEAEAFSAENYVEERIGKLQAIARETTRTSPTDRYK